MIRETLFYVTKVGVEHVQLKENSIITDILSKHFLPLIILHDTPFTSFYII